ncbi:MAG: DegV family protein [Finegoldia sp.]|nr:DegV family protein [Finegoldia sp.]
MDKIAILVDSGTDVQEGLREEYDIDVISLEINYSDGSYDDFSISPDEVYKRMEEGIIPSTSIPSLGKIAEKYEQIKERGYDGILCLSISSSLSGMYNAFNLAKDYVEGIKIKVIDTKNISFAGGFFAIFARELNRMGKNLDEIFEILMSKIQDSKVFITFDTLKYLVHGGRIGKVGGRIGEFLKLKPLVSCDENGVFYPAGLNRGVERNQRDLIKKVREHLKDSKEYYFAIMHGKNEEGFNDLKEKLSDLVGKAKFYFEGQVYPSIAIHTGPGTLGVGCFPLDR